MVTILIGKSASGKDTLLHELKEKHGFGDIITTTSRPIREGEEEGVKYINQNLGKDCFLALDPTLLLTEWEWQSKLSIKKNNDINKKYILVYMFGGIPGGRIKLC